MNKNDLLKVELFLTKLNFILGSKEFSSTELGKEYEKTYELVYFNLTGSHTSNYKI